MENTANPNKVQSLYENCDFLFEIIENATVRLENLRLWLKIWNRHTADEIPGVDGYTSIYPEWPLTVTKVYHWPLKIERRLIATIDDKLLSFLNQGAEITALVFRRYPEGCDWRVLDREAYEKLCTDFGYSKSDFGERNNDRYLELERSDSDIISGISKQRKNNRKE